MTWVRRAAAAPPPHTCKLPSREVLGGLFTRPGGQPGDLWRCDDCGTLWVIRDAFNTNGPEWRHAGWWTRWRYRRQ